MSNPIFIVRGILHRIFLHGIVYKFPFLQKPGWEHLREVLFSVCILRLLSILCLFIFSLLSSFAQPKQLQFKYLTTNNGLSSSSIRSILQDHNGFMWIGTYDGLNRYDGYNFKIYKNEPSDPGSICSDQVMAITEDRNKNLLIGSTNGLSLYDTDYDRFINYKYEKTSPLFGLNCSIYSIVEDTSGNLWLSTNIALIYFDRAKNTAVQYKQNPGDPGSLSNSWINFVFIDSKNRVWISTRGGLNLFLPGVNTFKHIIHGLNTNDDYSDIEFISIAEDQNENIWFSSANGLFCYESDSPGPEPVLRRYINQKDNKFSISANRLISVFVDDENFLWVGAENDGLFLFDRENKQFWRYKMEYYNPTSLNSQSIQCIYKDKTDNLWIGTFASGLNIAPKNCDAIFHYESLKGGEQSLSNNLVSAFLQDQNEQIWIGTDGGGINKFNEKTKLFTRFNKKNSNLSSDAILSLVESDKKNIWIGSWGGGLMRYNIQSKRFTSYTTHNSKIPDNNIFSVVEGGNNDLWLGTFSHGLAHYQIDKNEYTSYSTSNSDIGNNYILVVRFDEKSGKLFLGSTSGLHTFYPRENQFKLFTPDPSDPNRISNGNIFDILIESDTCVWIATQNGLNRFNPQTEKFVRYFVKDGLPSNAIKSLVFDKSGVLWVSTNLGICRFDYQKKKTDSYTKDDGFQSNEFIRKSALRLKNGDLLFGAANGFSSISPDKIHVNTNIPKILITDLQIFNRSYVSANLKSQPMGQLFNKKEITLSYKENMLTFFFSAMDFTMPEKNQYSYMLKNFDNDWIYSGSKHEVSYNNINPGEYVFRVRGSNNDGIWNEEGASLKIIIRPPWWETVLFKISVMVFVVLSLIILFRWRLASLKKQHDELEGLVKEKTAVVMQQKEDLQNKKNELEIANATKDKFFSIIAHDLRGPFNSFLGLTELMVENLPGLSMEQIQLYTLSMRDSATNLYNLLENLLHWSRMQQGLFTLSQKTMELRPIIIDSIKMVMEQAKGKGIALDYDIPENLKAYVDSNIVQMVIRNLLSNALKFTNKGGKVRLSAREDSNDFVVFSIEDTGIGMSSEMLENLFRIDLQTNRKGTAGEPSTGLGLIICRDFIEKHGGKLWVKSTEGIGSVFYFSLPVSKAPA